MRVLVVIAIAGCTRFDAVPVDAQAGNPGDASDSRDARADAASCVLGPWNAPTRLAGVDSNMNEWGPALSADKLTLYFESDRNNGNHDLYRATRATTSDAFGNVVALTQLDGQYAERDPTLSADGLTLYFTSNRTGLMLLYRATRASPTAEFAAPSAVNELTQIQLAGPALSADGGELFYSDFTESSLLRALFQPGQGFVVDGSVAALDVGFANSSPSLSGDGRTIYYQHKESLITPCQIYAATRADPSGTFGAPAAIAALAADADNGSPEISKDGTTIIFASDRPGGAGGNDLYIAERACY